MAQEHYCTAATQLIMSQLYPQVFTIWDLALFKDNIAKRIAEGRVRSV